MESWEGDLADPAVCSEACKDVEIVFSRGGAGVGSTIGCRSVATNRIAWTPR